MFTSNHLSSKIVVFNRNLLSCHVATILYTCIHICTHTCIYIWVYANSVLANNETAQVFIKGLKKKKSS